jgi:hypothetical protein
MILIRNNHPYLRVGCHSETRPRWRHGVTRLGLNSSGASDEEKRASHGDGITSISISAAGQRVMNAEAPPGLAPDETSGPAVLSGMVEDAALWCVVNGLIVGGCDNPPLGTLSVLVTWLKSVPCHID